MSIRYIFGRSGTGKSYYIYNEIGKLLKENTDQKLILIVPEQFTLQAERELIEKSSLPGFIKVDVLSFTRLSDRVIESVGGVTRTHIDDQGKIMILRKVIDECENKLGIYRNVSKQPGFLNDFSVLMSRLKSYDITADVLKDIEDNSKPGFQNKIKDISIIYSEFCKYLEDRYIDTEDAINFLIQKIDSAKFLENAIIWIDGFDNFTPQMYRIIDKLIKKASMVTVSLTMDYMRNPCDKDLFSTFELCYNKLHTIAEKNNIEEKMINFRPSELKILKSPEICHIESELYSYPYKIYDKDIRNIQIFSAVNIYSEIENTASMIQKLVRQNGYRWRDIEVVCNDADSYSNIIRSVFNEYNIPYFWDWKRPIMNNPIIQFILYSLRIIVRNYRYEDVFGMLKTGFSDVSDDTVNILENYVLQFGILGNRWNYDFKYGNDEYDIEKLNSARKTIIDPLKKLEKKMKESADAENYTKALYEYIEEINIHDKVEDIIDKMRENGRYDVVSFDTQIWNKVIAIFDQVVEMLGKDEKSDKGIKISIKEYLKILESGFESIKLGIIPTTVDEILIGDVDRSKTHDIKALLVIGCNDGIIPKDLSDDNLLSDEDYKELQQKGIYLGSDIDTISSQSKFKIYQTFTKPSDFLWISYSMADIEGKSLRPSILIERMKKLFKNIEINSDIVQDAGKQIGLVETPESAFKYMTQNLRDFADGSEIDDVWWSIYKWLYNDTRWDKMRNTVIEGFGYDNSMSTIGKKNAQRLYGNPLRTSVSRIERFIDCPFSHFIQYGLKPKERKVFSFEAPDIGELFHSSIELFIDRLQQQKIDLRNIRRDECDIITDSVTDQLVNDYNNGILLSSNRYKYMVRKLKRINRRAVWTLSQQFRKGSFKIADHEVVFGRKGKLPAIEVDLPDMDKVYIEGRIDRVDVFDDGKDLYVKIIDYKSGNEDLNLSDVYNGLKLQLIVYLYAAINAARKAEQKNVKPAGIFYFKIDDPLIDTSDKLIEKIEHEITKKLKMNGIALKDVNIVKQLDNNIAGYSEIIPAAVKSDGTFYSNSSVLSEEAFSNLLEHVRSLILRTMEEMINGKIDISPVKVEDKTPCGYCIYSSICQFDSKFDGNCYNKINRIPKEQIISELDEEAHNEKLD